MTPDIQDDNRLRQLAAWVLHPADDEDKPELEECLPWLIGQGADEEELSAVLFRAVDLPAYGRSEWFLLGWQEHSPPRLRYVRDLHNAGLEEATVQYLLSGQVVRLETTRRGGRVDIAGFLGW